MDEHKYPLHYASKHQQNITNLPYINHRVDINKQTDENETPLMYAAKYGHLFNLKVLIEHGANLHLTSIYGFTAMCYAAKNGHLPIIQYLLSLKLPVLTLDHRGESLLNHAVYSNHPTILEELLKYGLKYDCTAWMKHVILNTNLELFKIFLKYDFPINEPMLGTYLVFDIITINWIDGFKALIPYHPDLSITDRLNNTVLHYSVTNYAALEMTRLLLDVVHPSLLHKVNDSDYSPLLIACIHQHVDTVKLLLDHKANPNEISHRVNRTILMSAVMYSSLDIVTVLLKYGAKVNTKIANKTASDWCMHVYNNNYRKRYILEAEKVAGCIKENIIQVASTLSVIDPLMFHIISPVNVRTLLDEIKMDEMACYVAIHEGEDARLTKYRNGEMVSFSQVPIRCIGRSFGTRPIRKLLTSYLVYNRSMIHNDYINLHTSCDVSNAPSIHC